MAAVIKQVCGAETALIKGGRGEFTVWRDGQKILDTSKTGDFPTDDEVRDALRASAAR